MLALCPICRRWNTLRASECSLSSVGQITRTQSYKPQALRETAVLLVTVTPLQSFDFRLIATEGLSQGLWVAGRAASTRVELQLRLGFLRKAFHRRRPTWAAGHVLRRGLGPVPDCLSFNLN